MKLINKLKRSWRRIRAGALALVISVFSVFSHSCSSMKVYAAVSPADSIVFSALEMILLSIGVNVGIIEAGSSGSRTHREVDYFLDVPHMSEAEYNEFIQTVPVGDRAKVASIWNNREDILSSLGMLKKSHGSALRDAWDNIWQPQTVPEQMAGDEFYKVLDAIANDQKVGYTHDDAAGTTTIRIPAHTWETIEDQVTPAVGTSTTLGLTDLAAATDQEIAQALFNVLRASPIGSFSTDFDAGILKALEEFAPYARYDNFCLVLDIAKDNIHGVQDNSCFKFGIFCYPTNGAYFSNYLEAPMTNSTPRLRVIGTNGNVWQEQSCYQEWTWGKMIAILSDLSDWRIVGGGWSSASWGSKTFNPAQHVDPAQVIAWNGVVVAPWADGDLSIDRYPGYTPPDVSDATDDTYVTVTVPDAVDLSQLIEDAIAHGLDDALDRAGVVVGVEDIPAESDRDKEFVAVINPALDIPVDDPIVGPAPGFALPALKYDITKRFPLCIPFDVKRLFGSFRSDIIEAPVFHMRMDFPMVDYTMDIEIDMADYEEQVAIFRQGMRVLLLLGLLFGTHKLIKWH